MLNPARHLAASKFVSALPIPFLVTAPALAVCYDFKVAPTYAAGSTYPGSVVMADFNGDSIPDLAVAAFDKVGILFGDGNPAGGYTEATLTGGVSVKAIHLQEIRNRIQ